MSLALLVPPALAVTLTLRSETTPWPGVTVQSWRAASPATDVYVARVSLCERNIHVDATYPPSSNASTGAWAQDHGVQLATNGDFYVTGPQVYGDAVGWGVRWPAAQTGVDNEGEWYHRDYGWIAVLHDEVTFTHSRWVKRNLSPSTGWAPTEVAPEPPPGTLALVSGFPQIVIDGTPFDCTSPTASDCFPDRSDMRDRHPRTAMGLTEDLRTMLLVVVDGRSSTNAGMYGEELADTLGQLGAWQAFNIDGGGSSQMWQRGSGYVNAVSSSPRAVANHWGVLAGSSSGAPVRPGHCNAEPPCGTIGPAGGVIDDLDACFARFGDDQYWRQESAGDGGHLFWTNAWRHDWPGNWAWWRVEAEQAGDYEVSVYLEPEFSIWARTRYEVMADGTLHEVMLDQGAGDGWTSLGTFSFAEGGGQWVAVYDDDTGSVPSGQRISADALRLDRVGDWCGDGVCASSEGCDCPEDCAQAEEIPDNGVDDDCDGEVDERPPDSPVDSPPESPPVESPTPDDSRDGANPWDVEPKECGCAAAPAPSAGWLVLLVVAALRRRRGA